MKNQLINWIGVLSSFSFLIIMIIYSHWIYSVIIGIFFLVMLIGVYKAGRKIKKARKEGIIPEDGKETYEDIKRLALAGHENFALYLYRSMYKDSSKQAKQEIDKIKATFSSGGS